MILLLILAEILHNSLPQLDARINWLPQVGLDLEARTGALPLLWIHSLLSPGLNACLTASANTQTWEKTGIWGFTDVVN